MIVTKLIITDLVLAQTPFVNFFCFKPCKQKIR